MAQTIWFYCLCSLLFFLGASSTYLLVVRNLRRRQSELERLMEKRTQELEWEVLERRRAEETAKSSGLAKSIFLTTISHEVRTPMNGIIGMTELLLDTQLKPAQRDDLEMIRLAAGSLLGVINDVLDFAEIEAGKLEFENITFSLRESLGAAVKPFSLRAHQQGLELIYDVHPNVPDALVGDPVRLRQVLVNLIDNAIKFTDRGTIVVSIDLDPAGWLHPPARRENGTESSPEVCLHCAVSDPGIGVPPEKQQAIFEPFTQADGSSTRRFGGSGLGLAISSRLVRRMNGKIWVESGTARQGSIFHFTAVLGLQANGRQRESVLKPAPAKVPGLARPAEAMATPYAALCEAQAAVQSETSLKILLAEDNLVNQKLAIRLLEKRGHRVKVAKDGWETLAALNRETFDLVLMDIDMPEMDGFEATRAIREQEKNTGAHLLIMAMTAHAMKGDEQRCLAAGMDGYVSKPIQPSEMFEKMSNLLRAASRRSADIELAGRVDPK